MNQDAPRGWGWITNPKKAAYNRVYNRTSRGCMLTLVWLLGLPLLVLVAVLFLSSCSGDDVTNGTYVKPSIDYKGKFRKGYVICGRKDKTRSYEDKEGVKKYVTEIIAENVNLLDKKAVV
jgi:hypothetical protein